MKPNKTSPEDVIFMQTWKYLRNSPDAAILAKWNDTFYFKYSFLLDVC